MGLDEQQTQGHVVMQTKNTMPKWKMETKQWKKKEEEKRRKKRCIPKKKKKSQINNRKKKKKVKSTTGKKKVQNIAISPHPSWGCSLGAWGHLPSWP